MPTKDQLRSIEWAGRGRVWFLLYGGSSEDGSGGGVYVGKTADPSVAREHAREVRRSPYSTGYVLVVTDTAVHRCHSVDDVIRRTKEAANGRD